jgi:hypothetical protein
LSQKDKCEDKEEEDILEIIPAAWEYTAPAMKSFLAKRVHRHNKEISTNVSNLSAGQTRKEQRRVAEDVSSKIVRIHELYVTPVMKASSSAKLCR